MPQKGAEADFDAIGGSRRVVGLLPERQQSFTAIAGRRGEGDQLAEKFGQRRPARAFGIEGTHGCGLEAQAPLRVRVDEELQVLDPERLERLLPAVGVEVELLYSSGSVREGSFSSARSARPNTPKARPTRSRRRMSGSHASGVVHASARRRSMYSSRILTGPASSLWRGEGGREKQSLLVLGGTSGCRLGDENALGSLPGGGPGGPEPE